jgi:lipopolysaccharide/colanic/teichoic acid biosynthesis glycosyltransferase
VIYTMRRGARWLLYIGTAGVVIGLGRVHAQYIGHYILHSSSQFAWILAYVGLLCLFAYGLGLPELPKNNRAAAGSAIVACTAAVLGISAAQLVVGSAVLPRFVVFWSAVVLVPLYILCCLVASGSRARQEERDRVLAVVGTEEAAALAGELVRRPERAASLIDAVSSYTLDDRQFLPAAAAGEPGRAHALVDLAHDHQATVLVLDRTAQGDESVVAQAALLHEEGIRVRSLSLFYEEWLGKLPVSELERVSLLFDIGELHRARYGRMKRVLDLLVASVGVPILAVATPFVALLNLVGNRGPLLFRQVRVGKNGVEFEILKFRTMRPGPATSQWTTEHDPRVTPFGRWLRRLHLDELPQMINILHGQLAVVGPRPEQPSYVEELSQKISLYPLRHLVRPGLTGWAQVKYAYGATQIDAIEKLQYEFFYLRHQGLGLDLRILGRTIRQVLGRGGR